MAPSLHLLVVLLCLSSYLFDISVAQLVFHDTDANLEEWAGIFDDSLENTLHLEPLRLRLVPTPVRLDFNQSNILLNDIEDIVSHHFRIMNQEGLHLGKFRAMEFGALEGVRFEPGDSASELPSATVIDIRGIYVSFMDEIPDEHVIMKNLQEFINQHDFSEKKKMATNTEITAQKGTDTGFSNEAFYHIPAAIKSIKLTWASQGYTLAPSPSPVLRVTKPPVVDGNDDSSSDDPQNDLRVPLMAGGFIMITTLSLFLAKRYRSNRGSTNDSTNSNLRRFTIQRNEFDGLDFLYPSIGLGSENGGFPTFSPNQSSNIKVHFVDLDNQPISPEDIGEIVLTDSVSDISSLGQSENRIVVTYPIHSLDAGRGFPITNLTRVGNSNGPWALYHETQEGFDRLHDDDDDEWVSNQSSSLRNVPKLLRGKSDSLRYSSDASSLDVDQFLADQRVRGLDDHDLDLNVLPNENTLSETKISWLHDRIQRLRGGTIVESRRPEKDSDQDDQHSSVEGVLRSVV